MKRIFLFFTLLLFSQISFCQTDLGQTEVKCVYTYSFKPWENDTTRVVEDYVLILNKHHSQFTALKEHERNVYFANLRNAGVDVFSVRFKDIGLEKSSANRYLDIYKHYQENTLEFIQFGGSTLVNYVFTESKSDLIWNITEETDTIQNYFCYKATTRYGRYDIEAWFTPEIPYVDGPHAFWGLPGLIVKLNDSKHLHEFLLKSVEKYDTFTMSIPEVTQLISPREVKGVPKVIKKANKLLDKGYSVVPEFVFETKVDPLEDNSPENIRKIQLEYILYDNALFRFNTEMTQ